ncbi:hypothetical protein ACU4GD_16830 [Cupriavidus basilensis]
MAQARPRALSHVNERAGHDTAPGIAGTGLVLPDWQHPCPASRLMHPG